MNETLSGLNLPGAIRAQASKLLAAINNANGLGELLRDTGRAEGFVLGIETLNALNAVDVEHLSIVLEAAAHNRYVELGG
ncbi:hypothetical protein [Pseudomonas sp. HS6]|uniref:hypothetical protein n=1 Tax=Pseudomonas sp. HS6 TaxID=2850559 RepID=UPI002019313F|nr:hypothetical protein [Pseudomonas sp. HS6]UQS16163.1 hypothetical protein JJN09_04690 [Pseudomonas sp. HS6]